MLKLNAGPQRFKKLDNQLDSLLEQDPIVGNDLNNVAHNQNQMNQGKRFKVQSSRLSNHAGSDNENTNNRDNKEFNKQYLNFVSMSSDKQFEILDKMKKEIDFLQNNEYSNPFIKQRVDHLETLYTNLRNKVGIVDEDSSNNEINKFMQGRIPANQVNGIDQV
eukprot:CAMPEP_0116935612 /NCGR_PEP_ID=MMETSP0467-20121206/30381_1 /TAXON_ID=283647 /ORGANISM="Mesodinium pulex, Strain SPMC105" /LENGTH=162 /DNA_ID=CAMNT_0004617007 /DNA_START=1910 /DNA_END=2398 /DNA_ORIENTATION=-